MYKSYGTGQKDMFSSGPPKKVRKKDRKEKEREIGSILNVLLPRERNLAKAYQSINMIFFNFY